MSRVNMRDNMKYFAKRENGEFAKGDRVAVTGFDGIQKIGVVTRTYRNGDVQIKIDATGIENIYLNRFVSLI